MSEQTSRAIDATSDARTTNNVMWHEYRVLSDLEKAQMKDIKDAGANFLHLLREVGGSLSPGVGARHMASHELSIAHMKIEEAVMWAVKHITR